MRNSIKAALAATTGAALLLGGAGTIAYWTDTEEVQGQTTVTSGTLDIGSPSCGSWLLDGGAVFTPASSRLVPGDTLTRTCQFQLSVIGAHLTANLTATSPSMQDSALEDELSIAAAYELDTDATDNGVGETTVAPASGAVSLSPSNDGQYLRSVVTVTFPFGVLDNDSNGAVAAVLDQITVTATQTPH